MGTIAREIESEIETNPTIPVKSLQDEIQKKHQIHVSEVKVRRAKKLANDKKDGDFIQQYGMLKGYLEQLVKANPGSHVKIDVEPCHGPNSPTRQFRWVYICYGSTKKGFQMLGREFSGLDGCFMKGPFLGQILISVSIDANRCIYPVAFALVEAETLHSWTCAVFVAVNAVNDVLVAVKAVSVFVDVNVVNDVFVAVKAVSVVFVAVNAVNDVFVAVKAVNDVFVAVKAVNAAFVAVNAVNDVFVAVKAGLIPALQNVFPRAEHRFCIRHIHENMKKQWRGDVFKNMFFKAAGATSIPYYLKAMGEIKEVDATLYDWVNQIPAKSWSKAYYSGRAKCDI
ncbi:uncharacterized protein LOC143631263 [Bidens hawaiensis]|uniref:uncharacterized protein LOC143631263 n=1 Tax=Bidens hawaiensis TaxID=980011 RepID=UPI004049D603